MIDEDKTEVPIHKNGEDQTQFSPKRGKKDSSCDTLTLNGEETILTAIANFKKSSLDTKYLNSGGNYFVSNSEANRGILEGDYFRKVSGGTLKLSEGDLAVIVSDSDFNFQLKRFPRSPLINSSVAFVRSVYMSSFFPELKITSKSNVLLIGDEEKVKNLENLLSNPEDFNDLLFISTLFQLRDSEASTLYESKNLYELLSSKYNVCLTQTDSPVLPSEIGDFFKESLINPIIPNKIIVEPCRIEDNSLLMGLFLSQKYKENGERFRERKFVGAVFNQAKVASKIFEYESNPTVFSYVRKKKFSLPPKYK